MRIFPDSTNIPTSTDFFMNEMIFFMNDEMIMNEHSHIPTGENVWKRLSKCNDNAFDKVVVKNSLTATKSLVESVVFSDMVLRNRSLKHECDLM